MRAQATRTSAAPDAVLLAEHQATHHTMQAIVQRSYGSADHLEHQNVARPDVGPRDVLIEVHAAGLDRGTWHLMTGIPYLIRLLGFGLTKPKQPIPGLDVAGRVIAVGTAVTRFAPGDAVFGIASGSFAEFTIASEDKLAHKPPNTSFEQAAVAAVSGIAALQALTDVGGLQPGQRVLIVGASGGVGTYAVQLAKALGGEVTGVASTDKVEGVRSLGADHVIDYKSQAFTDDNVQYDLIVDIGGRTRIASLRRLLTERGTLVLVGGEGGNRFTGGIGRQLGASLLSLLVKQRLTMLISQEHHSFIERLGQFIESGAVTPSIGQRFRLEEVPAAVRQMEAGRARGKTVIVVRP